MKLTPSRALEALYTPTRVANLVGNIGGYTVGVAGQTVNLVASVSGGSTPSPPTFKRQEQQFYRTKLFMKTNFYLICLEKKT